MFFREERGLFENNSSWLVYKLVNIKLEFRESDVSPGKTKVKQGKFIEFISEDEGLF